MKKLLLALVFIAVCTANAQNKIALKNAELHQQGATFKKIKVLTSTNRTADLEIGKVLEIASFATLNHSGLAEIVTTSPQNVELEIPYLGHTIAVELFKVDIFSPEFRLDTDKQRNVEYNKGVHYRGIIKGDHNSVVSFNFFENDFNGIVSNSEVNNLVIGKTIGSNPSDYIIYSDAKMKVHNEFNCHTKAEASHDHELPLERQNQEMQTNRCVTMYFELDYQLFLANNGNVSQTTNWMTSVFNNVQTLFAIDGINTSLKTTYIWTTPDPYSGSSSFDYLIQFADSRPVFDADLGQLLGIDEGANGGVAANIDAMCTPYKYSYSDVNYQYSTVPTYSWTVQVITHELGHLMGSPHTHACAWNGNGTSIDGCGQQAGFNEGSCATGPIPSTLEKGSIMSYCHLLSGVGISFNNGFGLQPSQAIISAVNNSDCLSFDCINTCINTIADIIIENITPISAELSLLDVGTTSMSYEYSIMPFNLNNAPWFPVTGTTINTTLLQPNTYYKVRVRPICDGVTATYEQKIFATPADWCSGTVITDTGGLGGNYQNNQSFVRTLIPNLPQHKIKLQFTAFNLEEDYDYLFVYDGPNTNAPLINDSGFSGTFIIPTITSTAPDGSLTIEFYSDQGVTASGFAATVSCEQNLGINSNQNIDFTYYPNPTNSIVNIISKTEITNVAVYNIQGRLLYNENKSEVEKQVDISAFASGTYFFKVKFDETEANFKIVKN